MWQLMVAKKYFVLTWEVVKTNLMAAMEYRVSFIMQILAMVANDTMMIFLWVIFFQKFGEINGWTFRDTVMLWSITTINFAIVMAMTRGVFELAKTITRGELDYYLAFPVDTLWYVSVSQMSVPAAGDLVFGIILYLLYGDLSLKGVALFAFLCVTTAWIFFNFIVLTQSIAFFVGNFEEAAEQWYHMLLGFTLYPQTVFHGVLKMLMFTLVPAFFIATLPVEIINFFSWEKIWWLFGFGLITFILAIGLFRLGLKKYESGNLISFKM